MVEDKLIWNLEPRMNEKKEFILLPGRMYHSSTGQVFCIHEVLKHRCKKCMRKGLVTKKSHHMLIKGHCLTPAPSWQYPYLKKKKRDVVTINNMKFVKVR